MAERIEHIANNNDNFIETIAEIGIQRAKSLYELLNKGKNKSDKLPDNFKDIVAKAEKK